MLFEESEHFIQLLHSYEIVKNNLISMNLVHYLFLFPINITSSKLNDIHNYEIGVFKKDTIVSFFFFFWLFIDVFSIIIRCHMIEFLELFIEET